MIPVECSNILDVASGTGDIAISINEKTHLKDSQLILCDINSDMLEHGRRRIINNNMMNRASLIVGNAEKLPFKDESFDCYIIAFGIRNVSNINIALQEAFRVLKVGGKFLCLELSKVDQYVLSKLYDLYSFNIIPAIGQLVTQKKDAYQYLIESIRTFPSKTEFKGMISDTGFKKVSFEELTFGVAAIHYGYK